MRYMYDDIDGYCESEVWARNDEGETSYYCMEGPAIITTCFEDDGEHIRKYDNDGIITSHTVSGVPVPLPDAPIPLTQLPGNPIFDA